MVGGIGLAQLGRVWINNELVIDKRSNWAAGTTLYDGPNFDQIGFVPKGQSLDAKYWRWYNGATNQQPPLSMIKAEGLANCPGHRGVFGIEFIDIPLEKFGNSIPTVKVEVFVNDANDTLTGRLYSPSGGDISTTTSMDSYGQIWAKDETSETIFVMNPVSNLILNEYPYNNYPVLPSNQPFAQVSSNEFLYLANSARGYVIIAYPSGQVVRSGNTAGQSLLFQGMPCSYNGIASWTTRRSVVGEAGEGRLWVLSTSTGDLQEYNYESQINDYDPSIGVVFDAHSFPITPFDVCVAWITFASGDHIVSCFRFGQLQWVRKATDVVPSIAYSGSIAFYNEHAGGIVWFAGQNGFGKVIDPLTGLDLYDLPFTIRGTGRSENMMPWLMYTQPEQAWFTGYYNGNTGALLWDFARQEVIQFVPSLDGNGKSYYPTSENAVVEIGHGAFQSFIYWLSMSEASTVTLKTIIDDLAEHAEIDAGFIDTSLATATITGFKIDRTTSLKGIEDLIAIYDYEMVDAGSHYIVRPRNETIVKVIDPDDLGANEGETDGSSIEYKIASPYDYPKRIELTFADFEGEYENNMAYAFVPDDTVKSTSIGHVSTAIVLTVDEAKFLAYQTFSSTYRKRITSGIRLPIHKYGQVSVGDVLQITDPDSGDVGAWKVESLSGAYALEMGLSRSDANTSIIPQIGGTPRRTPEQTLQNISPTQVLVIDSNATRYDQINNVSDVPFAMSGVSRYYLSYSWNGAAVYTSTDNGTNYEFAYSENIEVTFGTTDKALKTDAVAGIPDTLTQVTVAIPTNSTFIPADATLTQLLEDETRNIAKIKCTDGSNDWEIVQYGDVTDNGDDTYTLGLLLRGRFGTEECITKHLLRSTIVFEISSFMLANDDPFTQLFDATDINTNQQIASISEGHTSDRLMISDNIVFKGRNVAPYAVSTLRAYTNDSNDIEISWIRRDRKGTITQSINNTLPLSEVSESYEVVIMQGSTAVRTVTTGNTSYTYTDAEQIADGVDGQNITISVCQISAAVGKVRPTEIQHAA